MNRVMNQKEILTNETVNTLKTLATPCSQETTMRANEPGSDLCESVCKITFPAKLIFPVHEQQLSNLLCLRADICWPVFRSEQTKPFEGFLRVQSLMVAGQQVSIFYDKALKQISIRSERDGRNI